MLAAGDALDLVEEEEEEYSVALSAAAALLPFQRAMVEEQLEEDGLTVMAPGLGLHQVVAVFLRLQHVRCRDPAQQGVLLVLGCSPWQRDAIRRELRRVDPSTFGPAPTLKAGTCTTPGGNNSPPHTAAMPAAVADGADVGFPGEVTNEVAAAERQQRYHTASCLFVTTRILVVDLLSGRLDGRSIAGMVIVNAHRQALFHLTSCKALLDLLLVLYA
jgi:hypothetical protein